MTLYMLVARNCTMAHVSARMTGSRAYSNMLDPAGNPSHLLPHYLAIARAISSRLAGACAPALVWDFS